MATKVTTHVSEAKARLLEQFKGKSNIEAVIEGLALQTQAFEDVFFEVIEERSISTAVGSQLDALGNIVGQDRDGLSDDDYRRLIRARIFTNRASGLTDEIIQIVRLVMDDATKSVTYKNLELASYEIEIGNDAISEELAADLIAFMNDATAAGVRAFLHYLTTTPALTFTFAVATFADGAITALDTEITGEDFSGFPQSGTAIIDQGLATEDPITFTGRTDTELLGVTGVANAHSDRAPIAVTGTDAVGIGFASGGGTQPADGTEWDTDWPTYPDPVWLGTFQEASGSIVDQIGAADFTVTSTPTFEVEAEGGFNSVAYGTGDAHVAPNNTLADADGSDFSVIVRFRVAAGDAPDVIASKASTTIGWTLQTVVTTGNLELFYDPNGGASIQTVIEGDHHDGGWHTAIVTIDRTNDEVRIGSSLTGTVVTGDISAANDASVAAPLTFGFVTGIGEMEDGAIRWATVLDDALTEAQMLEYLETGSRIGGEFSSITDGVMSVVGRYPADGLEWIARYTSPVPSGLWPMQDAPGSLEAVDVIAGRNMIPFGASTAIGVAGEDGRLCIELSDTTSGFQISDTNFMECNQDITIWVRVLKPDDDNSIRSLLGKHGNPDPRYYCATNGVSGTMNFQCDDGANTRSEGPAGDLTKWGQWMDLIAVYDWTNNTFTVRNSLMGSDSTTFGLVVQANMAPNNAGFHLGKSNTPAASSSPIFAQYGYLAVWEGIALTTAQTDEILGL